MTKTACTQNTKFTLLLFLSYPISSPHLPIASVQGWTEHDHDHDHALQILILFLFLLFFIFFFFFLSLRCSSKRRSIPYSSWIPLIAGRRAANARPPPLHLPPYIHIISFSLRLRRLLLLLLLSVLVVVQIEDSVVDQDQLWLTSSGCSYSPFLSRVRTPWSLKARGGDGHLHLPFPLPLFPLLLHRPLEPHLLPFPPLRHHLHQLAVIGPLLLLSRFEDAVDGMLDHSQHQLLSA